MGHLRESAAVRVRVPATSANVGPGFDTFGIALAKYDTVEVETARRETSDGEREGGEAALAVDVVGEGADDVPRDASHLVVSSLRAGLEAWSGERPASVRLRCRNELPHGRGLGSSAAAIVAGLVAARAVLADPDRVADTDVLELAHRIEGHPDNVAAALSGGFTISWLEGGRARALRLDPDPRLLPVVCVPGWPMSTSQARSLLPTEVPHADAVFTATRAALLVAALTGRPDLLFEATEDRLHQPYRASALGPSADLVAKCRAARVPAVLSGAGPAVLALLSTEPTDTAGGAAAVSELSELAGGEWTTEALRVDRDGARLEYLRRDTRFDL